MAVDRYVKIVLTVIALELFWIGVKDIAPPVSAQSQAAPTPVIIRGIQMNAAGAEFLPVGVVGGYRQLPANSPLSRVAVDVTAGRALKIESDEPLKVEVMTPVKVEADRPLPVESVQYQPARKPGE